MNRISAVDLSRRLSAGRRAYFPPHFRLRAMGFLAVALVVAPAVASAQVNSSQSDFAVYATGPGCGAITMSGNTYTDSFDSSKGTYAQTKQLNGGHIGVTGNINLSGNAVVNGAIFAVNTTVGQCKNGTPGISLSGKAKATGGYIQLGGPIAFPPVPVVSPGTANVTITANTTLSPGSYGNITVSGGKTLTFSFGAYNINSLTLSGNSVLTITSGPVIINVAGINTSKPLDFSGGSIDNPSGIPMNFQLMYGGTSPLTLSGGAASYATLYAPSAPVTISGGSDWYGTMVVGTLTASGGGALHYDRSLAVPPVITSLTTPLPNSNGWNHANASVSFTCSDSMVGIASCTSPSQIAMEGPNQIISGTATNRAGFSAVTSVTVNIDKTPPSIKGSASPQPNAAGWNNSNVSVSFTCSDALSGVASCTPVTTVTTEGKNLTIGGTAVDKAGNVAITSIAVSVDKTPPMVAIQSPPNGSTIDLSTPSISVAGTVSDALSGVASLKCNGAAATISGSSFSCPVSLVQGTNSISIQATDIAGNVGTSNLALTYAPAPQITITSPANLSVTNLTPVTANGTVSDPTATVKINGISVPQSGGGFSIPVPLVEGLNILTAVATNATGVSSTATVQVTLDTTPPHITIASPANGSTVTDASVTVTGIANDVVVGTVNALDVQVTVNGIAAQVANRSYSAANVPLSLGSNTIQAQGVDRAGNAMTTSIGVTRVLPSQPPPPAIGKGVLTYSLSIVSGNNQAGTIGTQLSSPLMVALVDSSSNPVANQPVIFKVTGNNGLVAGTSAVMVNTDSNGHAQAFWTLGQRAGAGNNTVQVSSALAFGSVNFTATGNTASPGLIIVDSGNGQTGVVGQPVPFPLVADVVDSGHNRVANVPVTFTVMQGAGNFGAPASTTVTVNTDSNGRAITTLTLGLQAGFENNVVQANFSGNLGLPAVFTATSKVPGNPSNTTISGVVLNNSNNPIQNVTMRLFQTNQGNNNNLPVQIGTPVVTNGLGSFLISPAPVGSFKLMADGTTAVGPKSYPTLEYDIVTVAGNDNSVGMPIYLPALNTTNQLCVDATHGGTLTLPQYPGFALTVLPGSATFPGGSNTGCVSVSPVNGDKVPMAPGFGQQPRFIVTIQPVGTTFNPPAPITLPNVDGLQANSVTEMYSYDHDLGMFVAIGTGTVSSDGSVIASNPGVGVLKAGWHCGGNPNTSGTVANCPACNICNGTSCVADPSQNGSQCPTGSCNNGQCVYNGHIEADVINQDDPLNMTSSVLAQGLPVFGGSTASTSDKLMLQVIPDPNAPPVTSYTWSVTGGSYTPPSSGANWNVGMIAPQTGTLSFQVVLMFQSGQQTTLSRDVPVGFRSDDVAAIGWINPAGVTVSGSGVDSDVLTFFPLNGSAGMSAVQKALTLVYLGTIAAGATIRPILPFALTATDKTYILNWQFHFAGNFNTPPDSFSGEAGLDGFEATGTNYKLLNRLQIKFQSDGTSFVGGPQIIHQSAFIGVTNDPIYGTPQPGRAGPKNNVYMALSDRSYLINDGTPDSVAVSDFNTLESPLLWSDIGSRIEEGVPYGTSQQIYTQVYPTYYIYQNFQRCGGCTVTQAANPSGNFSSNPYPPGPAPFIP